MREGVFFSFFLLLISLRSMNEALIVKRQKYFSALQASANLQPKKHDVEVSAVQDCRAPWRDSRDSSSMCRTQAGGNRKPFLQLQHLLYSGVISWFLQYSFFSLVLVNSEEGGYKGNLYLCYDSGSCCRS